jgi:hypothetical protein
MTIYAEVNGTTLIQYPFGLAQLQVENPYTNYPSNVDLMTIYPLTDHAKATGNTLVSVAIAAQPAYNAATQLCTPNAAPTLIGGVWTLGWAVSNMSAAQLIAAETALLQNALAAGVAVTCTSTPAINGTYGCGPLEQDNLTAITSGIANGKGLPGGGASFAYLDATATPHVFTAAQIMELAVAIRDYVYATTIAALNGQALPSNALTIA